MDLQISKVNGTELLTDRIMNDYLESDDSAFLCLT